MDRQDAVALRGARHRRLQVPDIGRLGRAKASGISFAFVKATEGGDRVDDISICTGMPRAPPACRARPITSTISARPASEQAAWFIHNVPRDRSALPPVLDMEWNPQSPTCKLRPPAATVRSEMRTFLEMVESHYGKKPIIYTSIDFFDDNDLSTFRGYPYWLRSVAGHPQREVRRPPLHLLAVHRDRHGSRHDAAMPTSTSSTAAKPPGTNGCGTETPVETVGPCSATAPALRLIAGQLFAISGNRRFLAGEAI